MKTFAGCISVHFCFLMLCVLTFAAASAVREPKRSKSSSTYALTPSLRVGRRSENSWDPTVIEVKRKIGKMMAFPRVGRTGPRDWIYSSGDNGYGSKRSIESKARNFTSSMWIGPRLGRIQKRDDYVPWTYIILNGQGPATRQINYNTDYTPRLGRESEELLVEEPESDASEGFPNTF